MLELEPLAKQAADHLSTYLGGGEHSDGERADGRIAATVLSSYVKLEQTKRAGIAMEASLAQSLLGGEKLAEYVQIAMPTSGLAKLLPAAS